MCPECLVSAALLITGIVSTGGVSVFAWIKLRPRSKLPEFPSQTKPKEKSS